jgi:serine/threonine-protein kinase RsbT
MSDGVQQLEIIDESDIVAARQRAREMARRLDFGAVDQSRIATAVSELARNVVRHATGGKGSVRLRSVRSKDGRTGIEIVVSDAGPGIPDVERAMRRGYTSGKGYGLGLPGAKRLMDEMEVSSEAGGGTVITIRKWGR